MKTLVLATGFSLTLAATALAQTASPAPSTGQPSGQSTGQSSGQSTGQSPDPDLIAAARADYIAGDYAAALKVLIPAAEAGDAMAQNIVGAAYDDGHGVARDTAAARAWFERSAAQGFAKAQVNLADMLRNPPEGAEADYPGAIALYDQAMAQDYAYAFWARGRMHRLGQGGPVDPEAARQAFEAGLERGSGEAGNALADLYRLGEGVEKDAAQARAVYGRTAALGYPIAIGNLAFMYETGTGGPADPVAAYTLYSEAAGLGDGNAAVNLADFIVGTPGYWQDGAQAQAWCLYGLSLARPDQKEAFEGICGAVADELSDEDKAEGARIFAEW